MTADPYAHLDAAYALGALDPGERAEFEGHLIDCARCRAAVREAEAATAMLGLLGARGSGGVTAPPVADPPALEVPDTLLPGLLRRAARERRRARAVTGAIAALAAACLVALVIVLWPTTPAAPKEQALQPVRLTAVTATARLVPRAWGTEIDVHCRYEEDEPSEPGTEYRLQVVDAAHKVHPAGSWTLAPGHRITFIGGTEVRRERISRVQITLADGTPVLQLTP